MNEGYSRPSARRCRRSSTSTTSSTLITSPMCSLMRQMADLSKTPIAALAGDAVIHHFRKIYHGQMILNVGITREHGNDLVSAGLGDFVAFGREYIANPDLVERI